MDAHLVKTLELLSLLKSNLLTANIGYEKPQNILKTLFTTSKLKQFIFWKAGAYQFSSEVREELGEFFLYFIFYDFRLEPKFDKRFLKRFDIYEEDADYVLSVLPCIHQTHLIGQLDFTPQVNEVRKHSDILYHLFGALLLPRGEGNGMIFAISHFSSFLRYMPLSIIYALNGRAYFFHFYYHVVGKKDFQELVEAGNIEQLLRSKYIRYSFGNFKTARQLNSKNPIIDMFQGAVEVHLMYEGGVKKIESVLSQINPDAQYISYLLISAYYFRKGDYALSLKYTLYFQKKDVKYYRQLLEIFVAMRDLALFLETVVEMLDSGKFEFVVIAQDIHFTEKINHKCIFIHVPLGTGVWLSSDLAMQDNIKTHFDKIPTHFSRLDPQGFMQGFLLKPTSLTQTPS